MAQALPTIFVSHGSPMHALKPGLAGEAWIKLGRSFPRPSAIVIASAHWETNLPMLTANPKPQTIHDFSGFPAPLSEIRYPAPGAPPMAQRARELLERCGITAALEGCRGLDHGAWTPLLHMYPKADIPVTQLSIQTDRGSRHHYELGRALAPLRQENVLIIGSGHMTHNLGEWFGGADRSRPAAYVEQFQQWVDQRLTTNDVDTLIDYRARGPHAARAHPTEEHFLPLFVALGAAGDNFKSQRIYNAIEDGVLAMDCYAFQGR